MAGRRTAGGRTAPAGGDTGARRARLSPDERRGQLVAAARRVMFSKGVVSASVSDIVREAGVAQGTFYLYFESKDEVVNAVAQEWADEWFEGARAVTEDASLDGLEKLLGIFASRRLTEVSITGRPEFYRHVHRSENRSFHDALARAQGERIAPLVERAIREGMDQGLFATGFPAEAAVWVVAAVLGAESFLDPSETGYDARRWAISYVDFILRALACTASAARVEEILERHLASRL